MALAALGVLAAIQGALAVWALAEAERHVLRGRVAADIRSGFLELSLNQQRLRNWVAQHQFTKSTDLRMRDELLSRMQGILSGLKGLADEAELLDDGPAARARQAQRRDALVVLDLSLAQLGRGLASLNPAPTGADATEAWALVNELFDRARGSDLRRLLDASMEREDTALREKRLQTNQSLRTLRYYWISSSALFGAAALLLAISFARALRRPLLLLTEGAAAIRVGDLTHRIPLEGSDEFATVARSMNAMAEELADHRVRESDKRQALEEQVAARTAELSAALDAQREMDARRRRLFADISHELRTPTTAIRGEAQVTLRGADKPVEDYKSALQRIVDAARQLGLFIDDLLTMARSDLDTLLLRRSPIDFADVLADAHASGAAMAKAVGVTLSFIPGPDPLPIYGDADRLRQLLLTLIDNAIRYSRPQQTVAMEARVIEVSGARIEVTIRDHGIGISGEDLPKVFLRSYRAPNAVTYRSDGSGLGLAIARTLARGHGGDIHIASEIDKGTTATLTLPLAVSSEASAGP